MIEKVATGPLRVVAGRGEITAPVIGGADALSVVLRALHDINVEVVDIGVRRPTLDDVFMELTGRAADEISDNEEEA